MEKRGLKYIKGGRRSNGSVALRCEWKDWSLFVRAKSGMFEGIVVPMLLYGCGAWAVNAK